MPDRIGADGVAFVEFATDGRHLEELERLLAGFGFARAARHVSKAVTLWRQGGINIVVNTETEGLARSSFIVHGTSVYAIGLDGSKVSIDMSLTSPGCPSGPEIMQGAEEQLRSIPGVTDVTVNLVWSPFWTPERIEPRIRAYMGF